MAWSNLLAAENRCYAPLAAVGAAMGVHEVFIKDHLTPAALGWAAIVGGVLAYDLLCPPGQTLSEGFDRALERNKLLPTAIVGATALHLLNVVPEKIDPIHQLTVAARRLRG